jgi:uncharacterized protein YidB (DUF937 family)
MMAAPVIMETPRPGNITYIHRRRKMGLLDGVLGNVIESLGSGNTGNSGNPMLQMVMSLMQQNGGLAGLVDTLGKHGLAQQAASWVGTGDNLPVSADQLGQALGSGPLADLAAKFGMSGADIGANLAKVLPDVVNQLTPEGRIPDNADNDNLIEQGLSALGGKLFG